MQTTKEIGDYVSKTLKNFGNDASEAIQILELPVIPKPGAKPVVGVDDADDADVRIWEKEIDSYVTQKQWLRQNLKTTYVIIWGQYSDPMRARLEGSVGFEKYSKEKDVLMLLKEIKQLMFCSDTVKYSLHALRNAHKRFNSCEQGRTATPNEYLQQFTNYVDVITYSGGEVGTDPKTITMVATEMGLDHETTTKENKLKINAEAKERYLAICFFLGADRQRYGRLLENTENNFLQGSNTYPKTVNAAHNLLLSY